MEKFDYLAHMFNVRTFGKKYENYVVNAVYDRVGNPNLVPITQQYVRSTEDPRRYYLLDLYFPQINYGIEVDERQHLGNKVKTKDLVRECDIRNAISCQEGRIEIFEKVASQKTPRMRSYEDINKQINDQVKIIKELIDNKEASGTKLRWQSNDDLKKDVMGKGQFNVSDQVDYKGITEIYNIVGHSAKQLRRCFYVLNDNYYLWVPTLAIKLEDGTIKSSNNYENYLTENHNRIIEIDNGDRWNKTMDWDGKRKRIVFMKMRDRFGKPCVRFIGVFQTNKMDKKNERDYVRCAESVRIAELKQ